MPGTMVPPSPLPVNGWEVRALNYQFPSQSAASPENEGAASVSWRPLPDPVIYPGIYSPSGYDMVSLLFRVMSRPNPKIDIGAVDCSVALIICDLALGDSPIVYVSDPFCELTGYSGPEVIGRNCRFLQKPPGSKKSQLNHTKHDDKVALQRIHHAVHNVEEVQVPVTNFKKNGERFLNLLSIIPLEKEPSGHQYAIGFLVQID